MLLTPAIDKVRPSLAAVIIVVCAAAGAVSATSYRSFAQSHIVSIHVGEEVERHVIPLNPLAEIRQLLERSDEHTSELQSLMRTSYAVFRLNKIKIITTIKL